MLQMYTCIPIAAVDLIIIIIIIIIIVKSTPVTGRGDP
jgi:hypothetical protein